MQVFLFLFLSLHLLSLQLQSLFKLSFVIIKQQCKQLSQKPLPKLLEMISSVLLIWPKKIIFPQWRPLHSSLWILNSILLKLREWSTGLFVWQFELTQMLNDQNFLLDWQWGVIETVRKLPSLKEWMNEQYSQLKSQQLLIYSFHMVLFKRTSWLKVILLLLFSHLADAFIQSDLQMRTTEAINCSIKTTKNRSKTKS